ncbi:MAG: cytochrome c [Firmicutes bacterium]|nr:cytochrome c [Bacillota bacterium]
MAEDPVKVAIWLDDNPEPIGVYSPPASFELDTTKLPDGPHRLIVRATDRAGVTSVRVIDFEVHNGPGIAVVGLNPGDVVEGRVPILVNAYAGTTEEQWEPKRAETPAPVPTWAWVLFLAVAAWAMFYWADNLRPEAELAVSPTFAPPERIAEAAGVRPASPTPPAEPAGFAWRELGAETYQRNCMACHGENGEGVLGFVASLRESPRVLAPDAEEVIYAVLTGAPRGVDLRSQMPAFADLLDDQQVAAVVNYIRNSWGHAAPAVDPERVRTVRQQLRAHSQD